MQNGRKCLTCNEYKTRENFYLRGNGKLRSECKECAYMKQKQLYEEKRRSHDVDYYASRMATQAIQRCSGNHDNHYTRNGIKCLFESHKEFKDYLVKEFSGDIKVLSIVGKTPSVDRVDPRGHYEVGNIRVIEYLENSRLGREEFARRNSKPIKCIQPSGKVTEFPSVKDAAESLGRGRKTIRYYANNGGITRDGYSFEFM